MPSKAQTVVGRGEGSLLWGPPHLLFLYSQLPRTQWRTWNLLPWTLNFTSIFLFTSMEARGSSLLVEGEAPTNFHQLKPLWPRSVEAAIDFHESPRTSIPLASSHRLNYFHSKCGRNKSTPTEGRSYTSIGIFFTSMEELFDWLLWSKCVASMEVKIAAMFFFLLPCRSTPLLPPWFLRSGWVLGLQRLLRRANYSSSPCGCEQGAK